MRYIIRVIISAVISCSRYNAARRMTGCLRRWISGVRGGIAWLCIGLAGAMSWKGRRIRWWWRLKIRACFNATCTRGTKYAPPFIPLRWGEGLRCNSRKLWRYIDCIFTTRMNNVLNCDGPILCRYWNFLYSARIRNNLLMYRLIFGRNGCALHAAGRRHDFPVILDGFTWFFY